MDITVTNNTARNRYEAGVEGALAFIDYRQKDDNIYLIHTEVPDDLSGKGIGSQLVDNTLSLIEDEGKSIIVRCPFVANFIRKNPAWKRILADEASL